MALLQAIKDLISNIFGKSELSFDGWKCDFEEQFKDINGDIWSPCIRAKSNWNKFMTEEVPTTISKGGDTFVRLLCTQDYNNDTYRTEGITTKGKKVFGPGRIEVRARFKSGKTTWPAIWLVNNNNSNDEYYEIDVCEYFGKRNTLNVTYHFPSSMNKKHSPVYRSTANFSKTDWNVFVCEWDDKTIKVYVNGKKVMTINNDGNQTHYPVNIKDRFLFIILSMQYMAPGMGKPDPSELPLWMDVDYVRHWKRTEKSPES